MDKNTINSIIGNFFEEIKEHLPSAAREMPFIERMLPYLTVSLGMSFTSAIGPNICLKDTRFIILVTDIEVRIIMVGFQCKSGIKENQIKILSPNILTADNTKSICEVGIVSTFPEIPDSKTIIENDVKHFQQVLQNNSWAQFIRDKL
eukprot:UN26048